jgi:Ca2+-binding EF-hand superfamily protein
MNQLFVAVSLLSLALVSCQDAAPAPGPAIHAPAAAECVKLCEKDTGMDADTCMTECEVHTDLQTHHLDEGLNEFVGDESYNEDSTGGDEMREVHNEAATDEVPECAPEPGYDASTKPEFSTIDTNGDGVIDPDEAFAFCDKACIPGEMGMQIFTEADLNQDKVISQDEFDAHGEQTVNEVAMDGALEEKFEGDDESNTVDNPPLEEFDDDNSGDLDHDEANDMFQHEIERRTEHETGSEDTVEELQPEIDEAINEVDANGDGKISGDEYVAESEEGTGMGDNLQEAADADEDKAEEDDLSRAGGPAPAAAAGLISHRRQLRHGHGLRAQAQRAQVRNGFRAKQSHRGHVQRHHGLHAKHPQRKLKFAEAMLALAQQQQRAREASFLQHQRRLHHAMLMHKQAMHHSRRGHRAFRHHRK